MMKASNGELLTEAVRQGKITPADYPGKKNEAFRVLIRAIRAGLSS